MPACRCALVFVTMLLGGRSPARGDLAVEPSEPSLHMAERVYDHGHHAAAIRLFKSLAGRGDEDARRWLKELEQDVPE